MMSEMRLIQPMMTHESPLQVDADSKTACELPVRFVKFRHQHHAGPSGYSRICDYIDAPSIQLSKPLYYLGETVLRPFMMWKSRRSGKEEYSRYDGSMELAVLSDFFSSHARLYHFVYAEKSFHFTQRFSGLRGHRLVGTVHHPPEHQSRLFRDHGHFQAFDHLIVTSRNSIAFWEGVTGKTNVTWLPNGVDTNYFRPLAAKPETKALRIVFSGVHDRDFGTLSQVVEAANARPVALIFDLIGKNPVLLDLARRFDNVRQHDYLSDDAYLRMLQRADLLLLPLYASTNCNVALEALACGTPVLTTKGGIEDYLDETCARIGDVGGVSDMVAGILSQAGVGGEEPLSRKGARRAALKYSWPSVARKHVNLYRSIYHDTFR